MPERAPPPGSETFIAAMRRGLIDAEDFRRVNSRSSLP
jgi:hypothetical protein